MIERKPLFPHVIELNFQLGQVLGCNNYVIYDGADWVLLDTGYEESLDELIESIRQLDFPFANCQGLIATHADVDHAQGMALAKQKLRAPVLAHPNSAEILEAGDVYRSLAHIPAKGIDLKMPAVKVDRTLNDGDIIRVGQLEIEVWDTPGHTDGQLSFRLNNLLFSADTIYRDGSIGAIDAHHGSDLGDFIKTLRRIRKCDVEWLLPSHGPAFRKNDERIDEAIDRLEKYRTLGEFGVCADDWRLMRQWEDEVAQGIRPE
jgi:hydroxyacylglutathione hydrolase